MDELLDQYRQAILAQDFNAEKKIRAEIEGKFLAEHYKGRIDGFERARAIMVEAFNETLTASTGK